MGLYSINTFGKAVKQYLIIGGVCLGIGTLLGSCSSCSPSERKEETRQAIFEKYTSQIRPKVSLHRPYDLVAATKPTAGNLEYRVDYRRHDI